MSWTKQVVVICLTLGAIAVAAPAQASGTTISDPAGDAAADGLDVTSASLSNRDLAFTAEITFVADVPGHVIVAVGARGGQVFRIVSEHGSHGSDNTFLLDRSGQTVRCKGLSSSWDRAAAELRLNLPSMCMHGGNYGAVHSWVLTEDPVSGRDVDYAPVDDQGSITFTRWIPRG